MPERNPLKAFIKVNESMEKAAKNIKDGYYLLAERELKNILEIEPNHGNALYLYSVCLQLRDRIEQSNLVRVKSFELNPCYFQALNDDLNNIIKNILENLKDSNKQAKQLESATTMNWVDTLNIFSKHKDLNSCLRIMQLFQKIKKPNSEYTTYVFSNFGITLYELGHYEKSLAKYQVAISKFADQFRYYNNSAILYYILGQYLLSQEYVHKSLQLKPGYAKSLFILSFSVAKSGRAEEALTKIKEASALTPTSTQYRFKILTILLTYFPERQPQITKQFTQLQKILTNDTDSDSYFFSKQNMSLLKQSLTFLRKYYKNDLINKIDQQAYVQLLDDYLIKGHHDKYLITIQMRKLQSKIQLDLAQGQKDRQQQKEKQKQKQKSEKVQGVQSTD